MKLFSRVAILGMLVLTAIALQNGNAFAANTIYWTDAGASTTDGVVDGYIHTINTLGQAGTYQFYNSDGSGGGINITGAVENLYNPQDIAVDTVNSKIYWTDYSGLAAGTGYVARANFDGTNSEVIVSGLTRVKGIDLDVQAGQIYYQVAEDVRVVNYNGTGDASLLTAGVLAGLNPDPSGSGYLNFDRNIPLVGNAVVSADAEGLVHLIFLDSDAGGTYDHAQLGSDPGDPITDNVATSGSYSPNLTALVTFDDANKTIFLGDNITDNAQFFSSGLGATYTMGDSAFDFDNFDYGLFSANNSSGNDGIYLVDGVGQTVSLISGTGFSGNFTGLTVVNPELPPGMMGIFGTFLSWIVFTLRRKMKVL